jgi:hypothetical protein
MKTSSLARQFLSVVAMCSLLMFVCSGCATHEARRVTTSGFLGDYSHFEKGGEDRAILHYVNPNAKFSTYDKILMEPISIWPAKERSHLAGLNEEDLQKLVDYFDATLRENLSQDYEFVKQPGPGVMIFRFALTEADSANVPIDIVSSVVPIGIAVSALRVAATGEGVGVGEASVEFEALDSITKERLGAAVDRRIGNKYTANFDKLDRWRASKDAMDFWAERARERMAELRQTQP